MTNDSLQRDCLAVAGPRAPSSILETMEEQLCHIFGVGFALYDAQTSQFISTLEGQQTESFEWLRELAETVLFEGRPLVFDQVDPLLTLVLPLHQDKAVRYVAIGVFLARLPHGPEDQQRITSLLKINEADVPTWAQSQEIWTSPTLARLATAFCEHQQYIDKQGNVLEKIEMLSAQLVYNYEEITLLHRLIGGFEEERTRDQTVDAMMHVLPEIIPVRGLVIALDDEKVTMDDLRSNHRKTTLTFGTSSLCPMTPGELADLLDALGSDSHDSVVVANRNVTKRPSWPVPHVHQLCLVPIRIEGNTRGWLAAFNREDGKEFGSPDVILLKSLGLLLTKCRTTEPGALRPQRQVEEQSWPLNDE